MIMMLVFNDENNDNDNHNQKQHKTAHSKEYAENTQNHDLLKEWMKGVRRPTTHLLICEYFTLSIIIEIWSIKREFKIYCL